MAVKEKKRAFERADLGWKDFKTVDLPMAARGNGEVQRSTALLGTRIRWLRPSLCFRRTLCWIMYDAYNFFSLCFVWNDCDCR